MKRIFFKKANSKHYKADAFIIRCFDDRFRKLFDAFIKKLGIRNADFESVAGGAKIFSLPEKEGDRDFMLRELKKSIRLHHTRKILFFTHTDCGAYGGMIKFNHDKDKEILFHINEHSIAVKIIRKYFPEIDIESYFMDFNGVLKIT